MRAVPLSFDAKHADGVLWGLASLISYRSFPTEGIVLEGVFFVLRLKVVGHFHAARLDSASRGKQSG